MTGNLCCGAAQQPHSAATSRMVHFARSVADATQFDKVEFVSLLSLQFSVLLEIDLPCMNGYLASYLVMLAETPPHKIKQLCNQLIFLKGSVMVLFLDATLPLICLGTTVLT